MKRMNINLLESVVGQFEDWRSTRKKRERIPNALWELVAPLMNQYDHNALGTALRVSHDQLKRHVLPLLSRQLQNPITFVEYPSPMATPFPGVCVLEFECQNGSTVKISGLRVGEMQPLISWLTGI